MPIGEGVMAERSDFVLSHELDTPHLAKAKG
jgi:hypothetical protein